MLHVPNVVFKLLLPAQGIATLDLDQPGQSRADVVPPSLTRTIAGQILHQQRTRPHEAHIPPQHVEQLREFIQRSRAQPAAERRQPFRIGQQLAHGIHGIGHRAKLDQFEDFPTKSGTPLPEENWRPKFQPHQKRDERKQRQPDRRRQDDGEEIEGSLKQETEKLLVISYWLSGTSSELFVVSYSLLVAGADSAPGLAFDDAARFKYAI